MSDAGPAPDREAVPEPEYRPRVVDRELDELFGQLPAILLDGPKGVGKTETAHRRAATVLRLDRPAGRSIAEADVDVALRRPEPVLVDEWHRLPPIWDAVKRAVDDDSTGGRFLLTGSAPTRSVPSHSGAARIASLSMRPMTLPERGVTSPSVSLAGLLADGGDAPLTGRTDLGLVEVVDEVLASGLPGLRRLRGRALRTQLDGYVARVVDRELEESGFLVRRPATLLGWLRAYAAATATTAAHETVRRAATAGEQPPPPRSTTRPYLDVLTALRVIDELPPWQPGSNHLGELTHGAKHHLCDPALAARLVGTTASQLLAGGDGGIPVPRDGTFLGALFESLVTLTVRVFAQAAEARVGHLRTRNGRHEVDLVVEAHDGSLLAIEVKLSGTVDDRDVRHLTWLGDRVGDRLRNAVVVTTGPEAYRRPDGVAVVPLALLGP